MKLKKGDKVKITAGKDKGKEGTVERVFPQKNAVLIPGLNIYKRHVKPRSEGQKGGIIDFPRPLLVSNVALICPKCKKVTRVGYKLEGKDRMRICRKCGQTI